MRILVVSDTHGRRKELLEVLKKTRPFDFLIHAGDTEGMENDIRRQAGCPSVIVKGNNDWFSDLNNDELFEAAGHRIFVTHGHRYGVSMGTERILEKARSLECDIAVFGHTHRPLIDQSDPDVTLINPGSLSLPRQEGRKPSYIMIDIDRFGDAHFTLNYLKRFC